jgi:hypothetical protein
MLFPMLAAAALNPAGPVKDAGVCCATAHSKMSCPFAVAGLFTA